MGDVEPTRTKQDYFAPLKKMFDYQNNQSVFGAGFRDLKDVFKSGTGSISSRLGKLGDGMGKVAGVAVNAIGAYSMGKGLAKTLGLGNTGQQAFGGASMGFAVGGPLGAAIGGAAGLAAGLLGFGKKTPFASANLVVGASGRAEIGSTSVKDGGNLEGVTSRGNAAASAFGQLADALDSYLTAGNYGTFGEAKIKGKNNNKFYSLTGQLDKKGRPVGTAGVDYVNGNDEDALQAWAMRQQILRGKFANLDPVYSTIAKNTTATTTEGLTQDLSVGKSYLDFIASARIETDVQKQMRELNEGFATLKRTSAALGLETGKLDAAYAKLIKTQREDFNFDINQQILQYTDPMMAAYNDMIKDYEEAVANASAVGGDLAKVEELYGLKRKEILEEYANAGLNAIRNSAKDLLSQLTASPSSPLSPFTVLENSRKEYEDLVKEIKGGDYTNVDDLQEKAQNYLDAARNTGRSSADFFDVFNNVTEFLKLISDESWGVGGGTPVSDLPELPAINSVMEKISKQNDDLLGVQKDIGAAIVDGNSSNEAILNTVKELLQELVDRTGNGSVDSLLSSGALAGYARSTSGV